MDGASAAVADAFEALSRLQAPFELARVHLIAALVAEAQAAKYLRVGP